MTNKYLLLDNSEYKHNCLLFYSITSNLERGGELFVSRVNKRNSGGGAGS